MIIGVPTIDHVVGFEYRIQRYGPLDRLAASPGLYRLLRQVPTGDFPPRYGSEPFFTKRYGSLESFGVQKKVRPTVLCGEIASHAYALFCEKVRPPFGVRALGVTVSGFDNNVTQLTFDEVDGNYKKRERAERAVDAIRKKYGYSKLQRGIMADDIIAAHTDIKGTHLIKPARFEDGEAPPPFKDDD